MCQLLLDPHITRQVKYGILGAVKAVIGIHELLVGQIGNTSGIAARIIAEEQIRKDLLFILHPHDVVGLIIVALHLVEYHAGDGDASPSVGLRVPGLLLENTAVSKQQGVEYCIHVYRHEIEVILLVGGDEIVNGLVLVGHSVEVHSHGGLKQVYEGLLQPVVLRAVQTGMLQNMEHARIVFRESTEAHRKDQLPIVTVGIVQGRTGFLVSQLPVVGVQKRYVAVAKHAKSVQHGSNFKIHE